MQRAEEYTRRAEELERMAERMPPGLNRDECLVIARHWRELAQAAARLERRGI